MTGGTASQKQTASREYECDGFLHNMVLNTKSCVWLLPNAKAQERRAAGFAAAYTLQG